MFGRRKGPVATVSGNARAVRDYVDPLVRDEKLRRKLVAALAVGNQARRRARRQAGLAGVARRLATDPVLRGQLTELSAQLKSVQRHAKKTHSHRMRNAVLVVAGAGAAAAVAWKLFAGGDDVAEWQTPPAQQPQPDGVEVFAEGADSSAS
jgi:hypothetical protein